MTNVSVGFRPPFGAYMDGHQLQMISGQTQGFIIYTMRKRARADNLIICYRKNKLMSVFNASVLLLTMNFVIVKAVRIQSAIASRIDEAV